jgi:hypothetical protein
MRAKAGSGSLPDEDNEPAAACLFLSLRGSGASPKQSKGNADYYPNMVGKRRFQIASGG